MATNGSPSNYVVVDGANYYISRGSSGWTPDLQRAAIFTQEDAMERARVEQMKWDDETVRAIPLPQAGARQYRVYHVPSWIKRLHDAAGKGLGDHYSPSKRGVLFIISDSDRASWDGLTDLYSIMLVYRDRGL